MKKKKNDELSKFHNNISHKEIYHHNLYPRCMHLLMLSLMFLFCTACVKHLFFKMKLTKTCLRNQLGETTLDSLLQISTESSTGFNDDKYKHFVDQLKHWNLQMRIDLHLL